MKFVCTKNTRFNLNFKVTIYHNKIKHTIEYKYWYLPIREVFIL